ncbi:DNA-processing protein DprA, partial [Francisella tularensis]|uniref:DNA-processing protein DprA n=1 Tax=Francisella tularensis TaxID=263 RepID=UPI002381B2A8
AVVGTGVDVVYPSSNLELYNKIINTNGLIISEFPLGTGPLLYNFPQRNRIISVLSIGVVVVEAASKRGSLITADLV